MITEAAKAVLLRESRPGSMELNWQLVNAPFKA